MVTTPFIPRSRLEAIEEEAQNDPAFNRQVEDTLGGRGRQQLRDIVRSEDRLERYTDEVNSTLIA